MSDRSPLLRNKNMLLLKGSWPLENRQTDDRRHFRYWLARFSLLIMATLTFFLSPISIYEFRGLDVIRLADPIAAMFITGLLFLNIACLLYQGDRYTDMMAALAEMKEFGVGQIDLPQTIVDDMKWISALTFRYFTAMAIITLPATIFGYLGYAIENRDFIFRYWFPYDIKPFPKFEMTLLALFSTVTYASMVAVLVNAFLVALLAEAVVHFKQLRHNLTVCVQGEELKPELEPELEDSIAIGQPTSWTAANETNSSEAKQLRSRVNRLRRNQEAEDRLRTCVRHHQAVIRFVEKLRFAFELDLLHQFGCSIIPPILGIIVVINAAELDNKMFIIGLLVVVQQQNQALFCWLGNQVTEESELVRDAVYGCDWFDASEDFKKSMRVIMSHSNQPVVIKIAGFIPLSMANFYQIMQLTYSYYMSLTATLKIESK